MDWYPHEIDAYDGDTLTLSVAEDGAYCRLLRWYYKHEKPLPPEPEALAAVVRVGLDEWLKLAPKVLPYFVTRHARVSDTHLRAGDDDVRPKGPRLHNKKADKVLIKQTKRRRDTADRMKKLRENNILDTEDAADNVTRHKRARDAQVTRPEERRGEEKKDTPIVPKGTTFSKDFDRFWEAYPEKVGQKAAWRAWGKAKDRPAIDVILAAIARYKAAKPSDRAYCNPATWINQGRWADAPASETAKADATPAEPPPGLTGWRLAYWRTEGAASYNSWVQPALERRDGAMLTLTFPTKFMLDWVSTHHAEKLRKLIMHHERGLMGVSFQLAKVTEKSGVRDAVS